MPKFEVELKRVVDDSYEIEIGHGLVDQVAADLKHGWQERFINLQLLQTAMWNLCMHDHWNKSWQKKDSRRMCLSSAGERARRGRQRRCWRMQCWKRVIAETAAFWLLAVA